MILGILESPILSWFGKKVAGKAFDEAVKRIRQSLKGDTIARAIKQEAKSEHLRFRKQRLNGVVIERIIRLVHSLSFPGLRSYIFDEAQLLESTPPGPPPEEAEFACNRVTAAVMQRVEEAIRNDEHLNRLYTLYLQKEIHQQSAEILDGILKSYTDMAQLGALADSCIIRTVRQLEIDEHARGDAVQRRYSSEVRQALKHYGFDQSAFAHAIHDNKFVHQLSQTVPQPPLVRTSIEPDFNRIMFAWTGKTKPLDAPRLLWDCCCRPGKPPNRVDCRIHNTHDGFELEAKFLSPQIQEIACNGLAILWRNIPAVWPPSIDSFGMLHDLRRAGMQEWNCAKIADVGCGTGFLGLVMANENSHVEHVSFSEWLVTPLVITAVNWHRNSIRDVEVRLYLDLYTHWVDSREPFDCLVCNPPYLPLNQAARELGLTQAVAGTSLLEHVIENSARLARRVFVSFSSLAQREAHAAADRANRDLKCLTEDGGRLVPFRIRGTSQRHLRFLKRRGLQPDPNGEYQFCHNVATYEIV